MASFLRIGHRGASGHEPENTLRAIRRALELGANGIEIDVRLTLDGELVVMHDSRLWRTTGATGRVARKTLAELRQLDAGAGERIPTLREVFDLIAGRAWLNIELKARGTGVAVLREVNRVVEEENWCPSKIVVSSFDRTELMAIRRHGGENIPLNLGILIARRPLGLARLAARLGAASVHLPQRLATPRFVQRVHAVGLRVMVYTVNEAREIARLREMGVDGVFTDYPERAAVLVENGILPEEIGTSGTEVATPRAWTPLPNAAP